jgi:NAD(P)H-flavin reductase
MKEFKAKLVIAKALTQDVKEFMFEAESDFSFEPGQFVMVEIADGKEPKAVRAYSIASEPNGKFFELLVRILPDGRGSQFLAALEEGTKLNFKGPFGHFVMDKNSKKDVLFIATGTGLAPVKSMMTSAIASGRNITLMFGLRYVADVFLEDYLKDLAAKNSNFKFNICISRPEKEFDGFTGRVTDLIEKTDKEFFSEKQPNLEGLRSQTPSALFDYSNLQIYMCGNKPMVDGVKEYFLGKGVADTDIKNEVF